MKRHWKPFLILLTAIPFALKMPYCFRAMGSSPPERWNGCFLGAAVLLALAVLPKLLHPRGTSPRWSPVRLLLLLPALLLLAGGLFREIHYLVLVGGVLLPFSMALCLYGWQFSVPLLPVAGMLLLYLPNTGFLLAIALGGDSLLLKVIAALALAALLPFIYCRKAPFPSPASVLFWALAALTAAGYLAANLPTTLAPPLQPDFTPLLSRNFRGVTDPVAPSDRQFFGDCAIQRFLFAHDDGDVISVLVVGDIANVHQIHPAAFCLRASGFQVLAERTVRGAGAASETSWEVRELLATKNGETHLFWQWYSTPRKSTSNFLLFRSIYRPLDQWAVFQLGTPVTQSPGDSRCRLRQLIHDFLPAPQ